MAPPYTQSLSSISIPTTVAASTPDILETKAAAEDVGAHIDISKVPKRKPVPAPVPAPPLGAVPLPSQTQQSVVGTKRHSLGLLYARLLSRYRVLDTRKKRVAIAITVAVALAVLALVIGLAVGLAVGKRGPKNLPLPTGAGGPYTGDLTYYAPGLGACGITSFASENICAVSKDVYDAVKSSSDPNQNPLCGLKLRLRRGGRSVDVTVVDRCVGCKPTDIDVSPGVFEQLARMDQGRVVVEWAWIDRMPKSV